MSSPASNRIPATTLVQGRADGPTFVLEEPLSFWGGLDAASGEIIDRRHTQNGQFISGRVLVMTAGRGSSSGSSVLAEAIRLGTGPAGIVLLTRDAIVTVGAMVACELYERDCPIVLVQPAAWPQIVNSFRLVISAQGERGEITLLES